MIDSLAFQTRARTIDHLGREQIADCPTAVSELWKNSYDAYASRVALHIYNGNPAIATIMDDGHGMNRKEFIERWLVVGTESKAAPSEIPEGDRNGLPFRTKQGQKGIGRLSSANLGPLLLVVSKRKTDPFVAALIDWRLFENPYLVLSDIEIPVAEFEDKRELISLLPQLFDRLMINIWGSSIPDSNGRNERIEAAWRLFSEQEAREGKSELTRDKIANTIIETSFEEKHLEEWAVWKGIENQGTLLAISDIQFDLIAQIPRPKFENDAGIQRAKAQFFQTLSNFTDPYTYRSEIDNGYGASPFSTEVTAWNDNIRFNIIEDEPPFGLQSLLDLEHVVDGTVDANGVFRGRVKAFGKWVDDEVIIKPEIETRAKMEAIVGPFHIRIGTFELDASKTTLTEEVHSALPEKAELYGGLAVYRNGLRVLPYGRGGNDFFGIDERRNKHAGREFWALRRLFGRVALRKEDNPNLRDKAGREGFIDNRAAKEFRDLVTNVLVSTARMFFGTDSEVRKKILPELKTTYLERKAQEARSKQRAQNRKFFRDNLDRNIPILARIATEAGAIKERLTNDSFSQENQVVSLRDEILNLRQRCNEITLGEVPGKLGSLEEIYLTFRRDLRNAKELIEALSDTIDTILERIKPPSTRQIAFAELQSNAAFLHKRLRSWHLEAKNLLNSEIQRITEIKDERFKSYHAKMQSLVNDIDDDKISLRFASSEMGKERDRQDLENAEIFEPYISALKSLKESIDLASLARFSQDQAEELRDEVDRLHGLAQLGITVEIIGHEIEGLDQTISSNLDLFPEEVKKSSTFSTVQSSHEALTERLRFLSPLKLSGTKTRTDITGKDIYNYVQQFFRLELSKVGIQFDATPAFLKMSLLEQPARIFPVFINLVNNAAYWVNRSDRPSKQILLDVMDNKVVVADNGSGVDEDDRKYLFKLFFTRKIMGGRGVGLYLCRMNLAAGGHTIDYLDAKKGILPGANFVINFSGATYE